MIFVHCSETGKIQTGVNRVEVEPADH